MSTIRVYGESSTFQIVIFGMQPGEAQMQSGRTELTGDG